MADRILILKVVDIVSGEELTITYDVTTSALTGVNPNAALRVTKVSDA